MRQGLGNTLDIVRLCNRLEASLNDAGLTVFLSSDMAAFSNTKLRVRGFAPAPMHDYTVCDFGLERGCWMSLTSSTGMIVGLQAYRFDVVDVNLVEWCTNYMIGVYMRRQELMVPSHPHPPQGSIAETLRGRLAYHGELWLDKSIKARQTIDVFSKLGSLLILLKWQPDAIWALTSAHMATRGYASRMGYPYIERGFLRWLWASEGIDEVEYLAVASRHYLEQLVDEEYTSQMARPANGVLQQIATIGSEGR